MIQEKDFLYRVPVKNVLVTTPRQQVRNPEILVDLEGGEFMHGNILDANSTNKLINQSVKDAVDNKLIESGYVTQDLLDAETTRAIEQENSLKTLIGAETSARTKGDEDLSAKIKAEQTRAEGKEKEISDKLAIVNGDSNTEGSFRKAIADVIAAAPEDLDTLKEIADKLADNDDLHTALNQAITDKADASALLNEVTRATGVESNLQAAINTKADATALSNYVLTAALNKQVDTLNTAISAKQDAGNYIPYQKGGLNDDRCYIIAPFYYIECRTDVYDGKYNYTHMDSQYIRVKNAAGNNVEISSRGIVISDQGDNSNDYHLSLGCSQISSRSNSSHHSLQFSLNSNGITLEGGDNNHVLTSNGSTININQYAKKTELPTVPTAVSQLTNDSNFITAADIDFTPYATIEALTAETTARTEALTALEQTVTGNAGIVDALEQKVTANTTAIEGKQDKGNYMEYSSKDNDGYTIDCELNTSEPITVDGGTGYLTYVTQSGIETHDSNGRQSNLTVTSLSIASDPKTRITYTINGITATQYNDCLATSDGSFKPISDFVLKEEADEEYVTQNQLDDIKVGLAKKQDKIKVNSVDVTNLSKANIDQLINIVQELLIALDSSGLIIMEDGVE